MKESFAAVRAGREGGESEGRCAHLLHRQLGRRERGKEQALAQIGRNADVIFQNADAAGLGVFQAARETKKALVVGSNSNQNGVAPEITIGSVVIDLPHAFLTVAREVKAQTLQAARHRARYRERRRHARDQSGVPGRASRPRRCTPSIRCAPSCALADSIRVAATP